VDPPPAQNLHTIQALRAAACLLVVAYHATRATWPNGAAGVDVFFTISGLVMGLSAQTLATRPAAWRIFAARRIRRLVPLYWLLTTAKLLIGLAIPATLAVTRPGVWNIAASYLFIPARDGAGLVRPVLGVGWTLQFEALFYLLTTLALALRRPPLRILLPILIPLAIAGFVRQPDWPAPLSLANGLVLEFCAGLALAHIAPTLARLPTSRAWPMLATASILLLTIPEPGPWRFLLWGAPAAAIIAAALALEHRVHIPRAVLLLGEASYAIYLIHPFLTPILAPWLALPVCAAAGVALHVGIDKPIQKGSSSFLKKRTKKLLSMKVATGV
jgi:peptidoglycan/LPS O-acetylase OafA/YrhL